MDIGFKEAGFELLYACDSDPLAVEVYSKNVDSKVHTRDVTSDEFHDDIKQIGSANVVLGGFPCQGFSKAGPKKADDQRNTLYLEMRDAVKVLKPDVFIAENVDGMSQNYQGEYVQRIAKDFGQLGYNIEHKILDAASFGVAQHRRRIFFVGTKVGNNHFQWPAPTFDAKTRNGEKSVHNTNDLFEPHEPETLEPQRTLRDEIFDVQHLSNDIPDHRITRYKHDYNLIMAKIGEGQKLCNVRFSPTSVYTWQIPEVFGELDETDIQILETVGKNRRHKKYGNIPNGNPLAVQVIESLSGLDALQERIEVLEKRKYLKKRADGYDLTGAMFCSGLFKRPKWDEPSPTVLTNFHNPRYFVHPSKNRPFSLRECARIQGFSDDFEFHSEDDEKNWSEATG